MILGQRLTQRSGDEQLRLAPLPPPQHLAPRRGQPTTCSGKDHSAVAFSTRPQGRHQPLPEDPGERASVCEHGRRALDRSLTMVAQGLPPMGTGDL